MRFFTGTGLYFLIALTIVQNWLWVAALCVLVFSYQFGATLVIPLAFLIDGYFGNFSGVPYLSIFSVFWYLLVEYIRPKMARIGDSEL
jgi:hypothetical protein